MNKAIMFGLALILLLLLLTACGVPQADYIKVSSDLSVAQMQIQSLQSEATISKTQIQSLQNELTTAKTQIQSLQNELTTTKTQSQSMQSQLTAKETQLSTKEGELIAARTQVQSLQKERDSINVKLEQGKARLEVLNDILIPSLTGEIYVMTESEQRNFFFKWRDKIVAIGDPILTAKFQAIIDTMSNEASVGFFIYLLESIPKALGVSSRGI